MPFTMRNPSRPFTLHAMHIPDVPFSSVSEMPLSPMLCISSSELSDLSSPCSESGDLGHIPVDISPNTNSFSGFPVSCVNSDVSSDSLPVSSITGTSPTAGELSVHVTIWNRRERRKIAGNAAPLRKNVARYLSEHPDCEVYKGQDKKPGSKPKKTIKRRRPVPTPRIVYASEAAAVAHADGKGVYEIHSTSGDLSYDYRICRQNRCGIHGDLDSSLRGIGSCPDRDALVNPELYDSDFAAVLRMSLNSFDDSFATAAKCLGTLPTDLVLDVLPILCSDFSDGENFSNIV